MNLSRLNTQVPARLARLVPRPSFNRRRALAATAATLAGTFSYAGHALAQAAAAPAGGIGAQMNLISGEATNAGGTAFSMACYLAATICFFFGVWAAWQSRQPQNRETGYVGRAAAGLLLCGLFASAGVWIGKASITASGGAATITGTPGMVTFGGGGT